MLPIGSCIEDSFQNTMECLIKDQTNSCSGKTKLRKTVYRHIPHYLKPPHLVAKRNARERRRVQAVNSAFTKLRKHVPYEARHKRLSKVKTLQLAIDYIHALQDIIREHDEKLTYQLNNNNNNYTNNNNNIYRNQHSTWIAPSPQLQQTPARRSCSGGSLQPTSDGFYSTHYLQFDSYNTRTFTN